LKAVLIVRDCHRPADAELIQKLLSSDQPVSVREAAYNALEKLDNPASLPTCIAGLHDPVETVAAEAVGAVGRLAELRTGVTPDVLESASKALLARASLPMTNAKLRENLLDAMATIGNKAFVPVMINHVGANEANPVVRQAALRGLGKIGEISHADLIIEQMRDTDASVRSAAVAAIKVIVQAQIAAGKKDVAANLLEKSVDAIAGDQTGLQAGLAAQLIDIHFANSAPTKAILLAAGLQPKAQEAVADRFHNHATNLSKTDPAKALAFLNELSTNIPDLFGATWKEKFTALRNSLQAPPTQPATAPAK
jgi:hypothetical protein